MAFDLAKPSMTDADWPTFAANIRENIRAIVEGDASVFSKTGDMTLQITTIGSTNFSRVATRSGNGTTSARKSYFRAETLETTPQVWHAGMLGTKSFVIRDETAAVDRITIDQATGNIGIGTAPGITGEAIRLVLTGNYSTIIRLDNTDASGAAASAGYDARASTARIIMTAYGAGHTTSRFGVTLGSYNELLGVAGNGLLIGTLNATSLLFGTNAGSASARLVIDSNGNVAIGTGALATSATNGFFYVDSCAGTPTGTPTTMTGRVPLIYDTTNNKLYAYNGAWKNVTLA